MKDPKNTELRGRLFSKSITPYELVRMTPEELANSELSSWREAERENALKQTVLAPELRFDYFILFYFIFLKHS